ncbi:MAG: hypothetical protein ACR2NO_02770 [Chloroflexota bacterium]
MDVLSQALNVAEQAEAASGTATLIFDLRDASHRAAYAAALAVLRISGVEEDGLIESVERGSAVPIVPIEALQAPPEIEPIGESSAYEKELRTRYGEAMTDLSPDEARRDQVARDTFPRVLELLKDGANLEAVAQIQYRRWLEENLPTIRS